MGVARVLSALNYVSKKIIALFSLDLQESSGGSIILPQ